MSQAVAAVATPAPAPAACGGAIGNAAGASASGTVTRLDLSNNLLGDGGVAEIARALPLSAPTPSADAGGGPLIALDLRLNGIGDMGAFLLGTALQGNESLTELDLRHNHVSEEMLALGRVGRGAR